jgi:hypothetical protein
MLSDSTTGYVHAWGFHLDTASKFVVYCGNQPHERSTCNRTVNVEKV